MAWVVHFKWERKKIEYGYYERERERKKKRRDRNLNSPLLLKNEEKKSSKIGYLILSTYKFKIFFLIQMRDISYKDKGDVRKKKKRDNETTL